MYKVTASQNHPEIVCSKLLRTYKKTTAFFTVVRLSVLLFFIIYIFPLINSSFYYFFTKNILSAESGADSPRSGCEAATRCTKTYTVSFL